MKTRKGQPLTEAQEAFLALHGLQAGENATLVDRMADENARVGCSSCGKVYTAVGIPLSFTVIPSLGDDVVLCAVCFVALTRVGVRLMTTENTARVADEVAIEDGGVIVTGDVSFNWG